MLHLCHTTVVDLQNKEEFNLFNYDVRIVITNCTLYYYHHTLYWMSDLVFDFLTIVHHSLKNQLQFNNTWHVTLVQKPKFVEFTVSQS